MDDQKSEDQSSSQPSGPGAMTADAVSRLVAGDEKEWARFCRTQGRVIAAAGHKVGLTAEEREDLLQNTCVVCFHSIQNLRDPERVGAWVYRVAYRQALQLVRRRLPGGPAEDAHGRSIIDTLASGQELEDAVLELNERSEQVILSLDGVGARCQRLLELLYLSVEVPAYDEVSKRLGMPIGSIGPTRARCLDRVRRRWKQVSGTVPLRTRGR